MKCTFCNQEAFLTFAMLPVCRSHYQSMLNRRNRKESDLNKIKEKQNASS